MRGVQRFCRLTAEGAAGREAGELLPKHNRKVLFPDWEFCTCAMLLSSVLLTRLEIRCVYCR